MANKTIQKNAWRELWQTKGRFISILIIVMLGISIFVGVSAAGPVMRETVDEFFYTTQRSDQQVLSPIGLNQADIDQLNENLDAQVQGQYFEDAYIVEDNSLTRFYSLADQDEALNQPVIVEGRLPEASGEIALDASSTMQEAYSLGDQVSLSKGEEDELQNLADQAYEVVGFVNSPQYIEAGQRGYTNIGNGQLNAFAFVSPDDFSSDMYTTAFIRYPETASIQVYSDEYDSFIDQKNDQIESIVQESQQDRLNEMKEEGQAEIDQGYLDLEQGRDDLAQAQDQLEQNRQQLERAGILDADPQTIPAPMAEAVTQFRQAEEDLASESEQAQADFDQAEADLAQAQADLDQLDEASITVSDRNDDSAYVGYGENAGRIDAIARVFPVFFLIVAILVTLTTMTRMVDEGRGEIGLLRSLGYSKLAVSFKYLVYSGLAGLLGWGIGLLGFLIFPEIIYEAYGSLYALPDASLAFYWSYALIALLGALIATVGASLFALWPSLTTPPAQLMQDKAPKKGKRILLERLGPLWRAISFNYKITFRNLFRYKKRMWMTIIGIAGCTALMLMGFGISDSVNDVLEGQYSEIDQYDGVVSLEEDLSDTDLSQYQERLSSSEWIDSAMNITSEMVEVPAAEEGGSSQEASLLVPHQLDTFSDYKTLESGQSGDLVEIPDQGALVTEKLLEMTGWSVGDSIEMEGTDGKNYSIEITDSIKNYVGHQVFVSPESYQELTSSDLTPTGSWLKFNQDHESEVEGEIIEEPATNGLLFLSDISGQFEETLGSLDFIVTILIVAAAMLAFVVLFNLTNVNIGERQKELATIKVLGFYDGEVSMYIFRENIFLTLIGILFGYGLGALLHQYIIRVVEFQDVMFGRGIHFSSYVWSGLLTILFSSIVMVVMHFKLKKTDMVEALSED